MTWVGDSGDGRMSCRRFPVLSLELFQGLCRTRARPEVGKHQPDALFLPTGCLSEPITASTITDPFLIIDYDTSEQFGLCLSDEVLKENLKLLLEQPLPTAYLQVVKEKLDQVMVTQGSSPPVVWASPAAGTSITSAGMKAAERVLASISSSFSLP